jgi:hypothetical protein
MPYRVLKYQTTPNPNALKVLLDGEISDRPRSFRTVAEGDGDALASRFFAITGVTSLLFNGDWFTVNKSPEAQWPAIKKGVERELASMP